MDNRYKFIRARSPFQSLIDYASSKEIPVKNKNIAYPLQKTLFNGGYEKASNHSLRIKEGYLFELISQGIWGGKVKHSNNNSEDSSIKTEPDILLEDHSKIKEIKAISKGASLKLNDEQMAKYFFIYSRGLNKKFPEIRYNIYRHGVKGLEKNYFGKSLESLIYDLSSSIRFMISMPFELIFEIYSNKSGLTSRYEGDKYSTLTRLNSSSINKAIAKPLDFLKELNLNPQDFEIVKRKFPKNVFLNQRKISPFPIVFYNLNKKIHLSKEPLDDEHFQNFYQMLNSLTGKKSFYEVEIEEDKDSLFGEVPKEICPF